MATLRDLDRFAIYETSRNTHVLLKASYFPDKATFHKPQMDRLPYKVEEGKRILDGVKVFDSTHDPILDIDTSKWNSGKQIMTYEEYRSE